MMEKNLMQASRQWWSRPDDERFLTLESLHDAVAARAERCEAQVVPHHHLSLEGTPAIAASDKGGRMVVRIPGINAPLEPTHWSFGQLCSRSQVPAKFARGGCDPSIVALAMNYNLRFVAPRDNSNVFLHVADDGEQTVEFRAITGEGYGRIYDKEVVRSVMEINHDGRWKIPAGSTMTAEVAARSKRATTLYASDRDVFMFLVDEETPIEIRRPDGGVETLFRGFMVWNSEVGKSALGIRTFLYRHVCDNRIVWGARDVKTMRIRHSSGGPERFRREMMPMLRRYSEATLTETADGIRRAMSMEVGRTEDDAREWLQGQRFTVAEARKIVEKAKEEEGQAVTVWDLVQGGTARARGLSHTDARVAQEERVSALLSRAVA